MRNLCTPERFDGEDMIMDKGEYDIVMALIRIYSTQRDYTKLTTALTKFSYFDMQNREVHIRLGHDELKDLLTILVLSNAKLLADSPESAFWKYSADGQKWINR